MYTSDLDVISSSPALIAKTECLEKADDFLPRDWSPSPGQTWLRVRGIRSTDVLELMLLVALRERHVCKAWGAGRCDPQRGCVYIHIYTYTYVCIYIYIYIYKYPSPFLRHPLCTFAKQAIHIYIYTYIYIYIYVCQCLLLSLYGA